MRTAVVPLSPVELATLRAAIDRIVPRDEFASATDAGVDHYIVRQLAGDCVAELAVISAGLAGLDAEARARHSVAFEQLTPAVQDAVLADLERSLVRAEWSTNPAQFFARLVEFTVEGYYADPSNGGNRDGVSWKMLGYAPRTTRPGS